MRDRGLAPPPRMGFPPRGCPSTGSAGGSWAGPKESAGFAVSVNPAQMQADFSVSIQNKNKFISENSMTKGFDFCSFFSPLIFFPVYSIHPIWH